MSENTRDVIIIGSGCAGHTAAIYAARANLNPLVFEGHEPGGQLSLTSSVENFPGFPDGINGYDLMDRMKSQASKFGAKYLMENVQQVDLEKRPFKITADSGEYYAHSLIIASGARAKLLSIPGEQEFFGKTVSTCATCDGALYKDKVVVVVGGGDTAMEDATFLTRFAKEVHLIHRRDTLRASKIMQDRTLNNPKVTVHWNSALVEICGEGNYVSHVNVAKHPDGNPSSEKAGTTIEKLECNGVFIAIGHIPNIEFLYGKLATNNDGYIVPTTHEKNCATCDVETAIPGVFAAGDVVDWQFQQAITAAGMGCKAAMAAEEFLSVHKDPEN
ncbi:thioredoxin-disulfide reductase [Candidatus Uabimicrobium sp. HlEnr_7]|uniref:thioredoxin-disulfide reductase n=1 Tax=Candidatus Uabimicrobium helgolandensis TaxID=3095367 RepID=UPI0035571451